MKFIRSIIKTYYEKIYRRPLYRFFLILLALPVHIAAFLVYQKQKKSNRYAKEYEEASGRLAGSQAVVALRTEVEEQLKNKLEFLHKEYDKDKFEKEADKIYRVRFKEMLEVEFRRNKAVGMLSETTFPTAFYMLLDKPLFFLFTFLLGWPMLILVFIYANAYTKYIFERIIMMIFVVFGVTFLVFTILYMSPLDAATNILGPTATPDQIISFNKTYHLDQPYIMQLLNAFKGLITFDLGKSYMGNEDVLFAIMRKFPVTLLLTSYSLLLAVVIAIPAGIVSAIKPYSVYDYVFMLIALIGLSIPAFWMGLVLILEFSINNSILPATYNVNNWKSLVMPAVVLGTSLAATVARMTRSSMLEVINQDYIVTAKAKGLSKGKVIIRHALGNAMIPIVTVIGLQFGGMLGGSAVTEKVFNVNGIGSYIVDKQFIPDVPVVLAGVVYVAIIISLVNLLVDILYAFLDPRIKSKLKSY